jgi:hypothetical protein
MRRFAAVVVLSLAGAWAAHADIRTDVDGVAAAIEANYFDPKRATTIADGLRKSAKAGEFDRLTDRRDLASELSQRLRKLDGHFSVDARYGGTQPRRPISRDEPLPEHRINHGFQRVERLAGNIGYIELSFTSDIDFADRDSPARRSADAALALVRDADAVIIDVRRNGGGAPSMVGYLVSAFVAPDADVYNTFYSRKGTQSERPKTPYPSPRLDVPLYVLTSGRTGSAAEAIAYTLQAAKRAQVVGERSAGAANPGDQFVTPQGYAVFVATGSPRNPINGRNWEGVGVTPDVATSNEQALTRARELALEKILAGSISGSSRTDAQWALEALRAPANLTVKDIAGEFGSYTLNVDGGVLYAKVARFPAMKLVPLREDQFYFDDNTSRRLTLERKDGRKDGEIVAIRLDDADGRQRRLARRTTP